MQTFLPYPDFAESAKCLDRQRLGKQRIEVVQLLNALFGLSKGWANHPACKMWQRYENALTAYGIKVCREWTARGYKDTCKDKIVELSRCHAHTVTVQPPPWLGDPAFHASHRAVLLDKDPVWYGQFGWSETAATKVNSSYPYVWPTKS